MHQKRWIFAAAAALAAAFVFSFLILWHEPMLTYCVPGEIKEVTVSDMQSKTVSLTPPQAESLLRRLRAVDTERTIYLWPASGDQGMQHDPPYSITVTCQDGAEVTLYGTGNEKRCCRNFVACGGKLGGYLLSAEDSEFYTILQDLLD